MSQLREIVVAADGTAFGAAASVADVRVRLPDRVQVRGDQLEWSDPFHSAGSRSERTGAGCLHAFVRLADAPPEKLVSFARRFGPLLLGAHGLPVSDPHDLLSRLDEEEPPLLGPTIGGTGHVLVTHRVWYQEPLAAWQAWARYVGTVLVLSHALRAHPSERIIVPERRLRQAGLDPGPNNPEIDDDSPFLEPEEGELLLSPLGRTVYGWLWPWRVIHAFDACPTAAEQWRALCMDVTHTLCSMVPYGVSLRGTAARPEIVLGPPPQVVSPPRIYPGFVTNWFSVDSALPVVAGQLLAAITRGERTQLCADCRLPYPVQRRRAHGRCPACGKRARSEAAQRSKAKRREREAASA